MAESVSKRRDFDHIRGISSSGRFFKRRRGQWGRGHSRGSINAALAITPATTAPPTTSTATATTSNQVMLDGSVGVGVKQQRHGRKRRRHRHSSFSGGGGGGQDKASSSYSLPPAVAAALAIPPKTPEAPNWTEAGTVAKEVDGEKRSEAANQAQSANGADQSAATTTVTTAAVVQPSGSAGGASTANGSSSSGKKTRRKRSRRKRRQWKPYYKLTAEERRELEEREEKRAERVRAQRFAHGQPVAPYNTTQFLLRDRELRNGGEPDCGDLDEIVRNIRHHTRSGSYESPGAAGASDSECGDMSSDNSDYSYLEREFDNDWLDEQRQRLEAMTKDDLVKEFMDLQKQYESAQRDMRSKRLSYEEQIVLLQRENNQLRAFFASLAPSSRIGNETSTSSKMVATIEMVPAAQGNGNGGRESSETDDVNCSASSFASASESTVT